MKIFHKKIHFNRTINDDFNILREGGGVGPHLWNLQILSQYSINSQIKVFHTKFYHNRMINEDFEILEGGGEGPPICDLNFLCPNFRLTIK